MFTGLIEELGEISALRRSGGIMRLEVVADGVFDDLEIGNSISIDGVCQTVVSLNGKRFTVEAVEETLRRTTFAELQRGDLVNLERPLKASGRLGGHMVQGHVDGVGTIKRLEVLKGSWILHVQPPPPLGLYIAPKGSIAVDGISLTVVDIGNQGFTISLIPHTFGHTNIQRKKPGDRVNIEVDVVARYLERLLAKKNVGALNFDKLKRMGYDA